MLSNHEIQSLNNVLATFGWLEGSSDGSVTFFIKDSLHPRFATEKFSADEARDVTAFSASLNQRATEAGLSALTMVAAVVRAYAAARVELQSSAEAVPVFVKILQKNWLGVFLSLKNLIRGFAPTLRYPRIFF